MEKKILDWGVKSDKKTKQPEIEIHEIIHSEKSKRNLIRNNNRIKSLIKSEKILKKKISGVVLEVGAGNGYASVFLSLNRPIDKIYCSEVTISGVNKLIRKNFKENNVDIDKYELVHGSFNKIPLKNNFDFVIALGALHHSSDLRRTLDELNSCLKEGGVLIAQEPFTNDFTKNDFFIERSNKEHNVQGIVKIKNKERDDNFFRKCEYLTAAHHSGFEIIYFDEIKQSLKGRIRILFKEKSIVKNGLIILKKVMSKETIPHRWE